MGPTGATAGAVGGAAGARGAAGGCGAADSGAPAATGPGGGGGPPTPCAADGSARRAAGVSAPSTAATSAPFMVSVGVSSGRGGTADRSYPHAPQKRSPASSGSAQLGHVGRAACLGIWDINYTHVRGR
ncbi:hypothetical protein RKD18_003218 [Streptomyces phaeoluteigriseus]